MVQAPSNRERFLNRVSLSLLSRYLLHSDLSVVERLLLDRLLQDARVDLAAVDNEAVRYACERGHLPVVMQRLECPRVLRTMYLLLVARALVIDGGRLTALLRRDAMLRRGHLQVAAAVFTRRRVQQVGR